MFVLRRNNIPKSGLDSAGVSPVNSERDSCEDEESSSQSGNSESSTGSTVASFQMSSPTKYFSNRQMPRPPPWSGPRSLPSFDLPLLPPRPKFHQNMSSIHESGLPPPPALKPKPSPASLISSSSLLHLSSSSSSSSSSNRASLGSLSSGSRSSSASFHDYENYFYI